MQKNQFNKLKKKLLVMTGICCTISVALAGSDYSINKYVIANGGGSSAAGNYQVQGTIAQVATSQSAANSYQVNSGYWQQTGVANDVIFKHGFE